MGVLDLNKLTLCCCSLGYFSFVFSIVSICYRVFWWIKIFNCHTVACTLCSVWETALKHAADWNSPGRRKRYFTVDTDVIERQWQHRLRRPQLTPASVFCIHIAWSLDSNSQCWQEAHPRPNRLMLCDKEWGSNKTPKLSCLLCGKNIKFQA